MINAEHASCGRLDVCSGGEIPDLNAWDSLSKTSGEQNVFMTTSWLSAWKKAFSLNQELLFVQVFFEGQNIAAAAFQRGERHIVFAGQPVSDYSDILVHHELPSQVALNAIQLILEKVFTCFAGGKNLKLGRMPASSRAFRLLSQSGYYTVQSEATVAPRMDMASVDKALKKKSLTRHFNKLRKTGQLETQTYLAGNDISLKLEEYFALHIKRWQNTDTPSRFLDPAHKEFFHALVTFLTKDSALRFSEVRLDGELIAAHFGFTLGDVFTWYTPCYNPEWSSYSPGEVLLRHLLETAKHEHAKVFDFTLGNESFKLRFATELPMTYNVFVTRRAVDYYGKKAVGLVKQVINA